MPKKNREPEKEDRISLLILYPARKTMRRRPLRH